MGHLLEFIPTFAICTIMVWICTAFYFQSGVIGVASSKHHSTIDDILKSTDCALYQAKVNKNDVILAETEPIPA